MPNFRQNRIVSRTMSTLAVVSSITFVTACGMPANQASNQPSKNSSQATIANSSDAHSPKSTSATTTEHYPITLTDGTGTKVTVTSPPLHVASDTEGTDEILVSLVGKKRIALVTNLSSNPIYSNVVSKVKGIPQISQNNPETILAAHPDLVLMASYVKQGVVSQVRNAGVPVYEFNKFTSVSSIEHNIRVIGRLVGKKQKAKQLINNFTQNVSKIEQSVAGRQKPSVLDYSSYGFAAGSNTTVNEIVRDAGGRNVASKLNGWQKITDEEIVKMNPDVIIDSKQDGAFLKKLAKNPALQSVSAIKNHRLYAIPDADLSSVSQYIVKGMVDVAKVLHPHVTMPNIQVMK